MQPSKNTFAYIHYFSSFWMITLYVIRLPGVLFFV